ncbi:hypothetical protein GCM10027292_13740 [Hydrogenophaga aquatica]
MRGLHPPDGEQPYQKALMRQMTPQTEDHQQRQQQAGPKGVRVRVAEAVQAFDMVQFHSGQ